MERATTLSQPEAEAEPEKLQLPEGTAAPPHDA